MADSSPYRDAVKDSNSCVNLNSSNYHPYQALQSLQARIQMQFAAYCHPDANLQQSFHSLLCCITFYNSKTKKHTSCHIFNSIRLII